MAKPEQELEEFFSYHRISLEELAGISMAEVKKQSFQEKFMKDSLEEAEPGLIWMPTKSP